MAFGTSSTFISDSLVILGAAGIIIPSFARFRINPVIGFILVGMLVGPAGLGAYVAEAPWLRHVTITDPERIGPFAELGVILLLFSIGLELSFRRLWTMRRLVFGLGLTELLLCALAIGATLAMLGQNWPGAIGLGLALALSSTALVLPMTGTKSPVGRSAFGMLLFEDVALVPIIFALGALAPTSADGGIEGLARTLWIGGATVAAMLVLGRLILPRLFAQAARTKSPELFLSASLLVAILASIATSAAGLSPIVGALLAGILIAETEYGAEVEVMTAPFKGLALGVFLISVGMTLDLRVIAANWQQLILAVAGVVIAKTAITTLLLRLSGSRPGVAAETGLLMASPSETTLIVLAAAAQAQLIMPSTAAFWQIVTALGLTITPLLARVGRSVARRVEMAGYDQLPQEPETEGRTVVIGYGRVGSLVAEMLRRHGMPMVAIESNPDTVATARREGLPIFLGDISRPGMIDRLELERARAVILTMDDPVQAIRIAEKIRKRHPDLSIIARARDADHAAALYRAGVTDAVPETLESSLQLSEAVLTDLGIAMGPVIASIHERRDAFRQEIKEAGMLDREPRLGGTRLADI
ncbi:cation:proton antiporter [Sphingomonas sp. C3-2]|uniref:cation:proton antiporter domain-containing protein n=1 Tax=Sphingomonas sp. C3-2 TaxID=3062169 RepID=UPI00294B8E8C|nr:cation:proton antiporter [Sphingomonas sp. C3-2]WOK36775.1 cation:proton antiporter [Sphingomonas sp. C3-2]